MHYRRVMKGKELAEHRNTWKEIIEVAMGLNGPEYAS